MSIEKIFKHNIQTPLQTSASLMPWIDMFMSSALYVHALLCFIIHANIYQITQYFVMSKLETACLHSGIKTNFMQDFLYWNKDHVYVYTYNSAMLRVVYVMSFKKIMYFKLLSKFLVFSLL